MYRRIFTLPVTFDGNVYTKGTIRAVSAEDKKRSYGEISDAAKEKLKNV